MLELAPTEIEGPVSGRGLECECMLCDLPLGATHEPIEWRLVWEFNRPPAAVNGEGVMLMCDHCFRDWIGNPDDFGGDALRFHRV